MFLFGGIALYASLFFTPPEAGWFSYVPLSSRVYSQSNGQEAWIYMIHLTGLSSILGAINFIATVHNMRARGMGWGRLPQFVWAMLIYAYLVVIALSSLAATVTMLLLDRNFGTHFFDPTAGGSALLWQHLFWFFGHPEVYILVLPASRSSATRRSPHPPRASRSSACSCGRTTCSRCRPRPSCSPSSCCPRS